jgi:dinuclear metal center YbgI/SA1388 family protein
MTTVRDIDVFMTKVAPKELSEEWDNDGVMLCGNFDGKAGKILCALEVSDKLISYAVENGFDLVVTHHPFIFRKLPRIDGERFEKIAPLIKNGISVLSYHTRLDSAEGGVNDTLAEVVGLENTVGFGGESGNLGRIGDVSETTFEDFGKHLLSVLGCKNIRACDGGKTIKRVALVGGSGKDFLFDAAFSGADAFVTSEIPHHLYEEAKNLGLSVYDCGHYYTENCISKKIADMIKKEFPEVYIEVFDVESPYICIQ